MIKWLRSIKGPPPIRHYYLPSNLRHQLKKTPKRTLVFFGSHDALDRQAMWPGEIVQNSDLAI
jgi:hypothetical protein